VTNPKKKGGIGCGTTVPHKPGKRILPKVDRESVKGSGREKMGGAFNQEGSGSSGKEVETRETCRPEQARYDPVDF